MSTGILIALCALATYGTRVAGHVVLQRFGALNPRVEAALDAVPVAVLTAIVAPAFVEGGTAEIAALLAAGLAGLRLPLPLVVLVGVVVLVTMRGVG